MFSLPDMQTMKRLLPLLLVVLSLVLYGGSFSNQWVLDDVPAVVDNEAAHWPLKLDQIFTENYWGDRPGYESLTIYRPLATLSFALVDGLSAAPGWDLRLQRLANILLYGLVCWLVALLALRLFGSLGAAYAAGLLFCVHPLHSEVVLGVVSRAELLAAAAVLGALVNHLRWGKEGSPLRRAGLAWLMLALALMSKENGATLVVALALLDGGLLLARRLGWSTGDAAPAPAWVHGGNLALLGACLLLRSQVLPGVLAGDLAFADNPLVGASFLARALTPFKILYLYAQLLVAPLGLTVDYSYNHVQVVGSLADPSAWAGLALAAGMVVLALAGLRRSRPLFFAAVCFAATYSVVSNLVFLSTIIMAERLLFLPSVFLVLLPVQAGLQLVDRPATRRFAVAALVLVCLLFSWRVLVRVPDWRTPLSLARAAVEVAPASAKSQHLLAIELHNSGDRKGALRHYHAAVTIDPSNLVAQANYGAALAMTGHPERALEHLGVALELSRGRHPKARHWMCFLAPRLGRTDLAERWCLKGEKR